MLAVHWAGAHAAGRRVFTANLNINYRRPVLAGTRVAVACAIDRVDRRKLFISATVADADDAGAAALADANVLYLVEAP